MAVCIACQSEDKRVDPVSELCPYCQDELLPKSDVSQTNADIEEVQTSTILLTTEAASNLSIKTRLGIVSAECVIGQHIFKDMAAGLRDLFGGRSKVMQNGLRDAKTLVLEELSDEAAQLGADAVVAVQFHYASIGGTGSVNMLLLTATGTAVKLSP